MLPGPKTDLRIDSLRPERPDAMVQGLEGRPLWERAVYTALHGARLSSVPSEISLLTLPCPRAQRSSASVSLSLFRPEM